MVLTIFSAFAEIVSLGAVLPFIAAITQPDKVMEYAVVAYLAEALEITTGAQLVLPLAVAFGLAAVLAGALRLCLVWGTVHLGNGCGADLSVEVYRRTLFQPYAVHISRSTSQVISSITQKVAAASGVLSAVMILITSTLLFLAIVTTLVVVDPTTAFAASMSFGICYAAIAYITRRRLATNSGIVAREQDTVVKALQEGLGSIRDVLLDGSQNVYINFYEKSVNKLRRSHVQLSFISQFPRYVMESLALVLVACFVIFLNGSPAGVSESLSVLAILALGAQRLLPIVQQVYGNWSVIAGNHAALLDVLVLLEQPLPSEAILPPVQPVGLKQRIDLSNVSFRYTEMEPLVLSGIDLTITKGSRVGIVGGTGGGKSTLLDLLMGLHSPTDGEISIDGNIIDSEIGRSSWRRSIAHVPQNIYLADCSVSENIAFGVPPNEIDFARVCEAAERAQIAEFIENGLDGYNANVGERGVRLSGGQRQRIGIARALYKNASVIIFDEATSALDDKTEQAVMQTIEGLSREITMLIVAHRISTLKDCDFIIKLDGGKIVQQSNYDQMFRLSNQI